MVINKIKVFIIILICIAVCVLFYLMFFYGTAWEKNRAKQEIQNYLKDRKCEDNSLFCSSKFPYTRLGIRAIEKEIKNIANRSNIDINVFPHLCRHTYGTSKSSRFGNWIIGN